MRFLLSYEEKAFEVNSTVWHYIVNANQEEIESISVDDDVAIANVEDIDFYIEVCEKAKISNQKK